ncbi:MAG: Spy/CpxP family protein refolding chaperone [Candidatus Acidiferrales bacterium]
MNRSHALAALAAFALTAAVGAAWSFAQTPPSRPRPLQPPHTMVLDDQEIEIDADEDMPGPHGFMGRHGHMGGLMGGPMFAGMAEELGLTEEQQTKLRALHFETAKSGLQAHTNLALRRLELEELLEQDEPNQAELDKRIKALTDAQGAAFRQRIEHRMAFRRVLTPEQRTKLRSTMREHMRHRMMRFREGGERRMRMRGPEMGPFERREPERPPEPPEL